MSIKTNAPAVAKDISLYEIALFSNIDQAHRQNMASIVRDAIDYIDKKDLISQGDLRSSITSEIDRQIDLLIGEAGSNVAHAEAVHQGTPPHWPPVNQIQEWVEQQVRRGTMTTDDVDATAFLVARAISRRGTRPNPFLAVALRLNREPMIRRVGKAIRQTKTGTA